MILLLTLGVLYLTVACLMFFYLINKTGPGVKQFLINIVQAVFWFPCIVRDFWIVSSNRVSDDN